MAAIRTDDLTRRFGDVVAVDGLDLTVEEGEVFGFLGPNGAGKSTTINVLLGFIEPSSGGAEVLGADVTTHSRSVRERIGLLPEGYGLYENLTGREHLVSAIETKGSADDPDELLDRVGLDAGDARRAAGGYSKGMQQRLGLAIALVGDPDLLVLDEPSSGLDPKGIKLLRDIVREETDRGATVFFSSHILDQVEKVCDRVGIMAKGELVALDTLGNLREQLGVGGVVEATVDAVPDLGPVRAVEGVRDVTAEDDVVRVTCAEPAAKMPALRRIDDAATVSDIGIDTTSLESLFEQYTNGEHGRDATAAEATTAEDATAVTGGED
ncbi:ABC transporter ATP-binding protein [Haloarchaeobius salinus]|uniref:ABC transporter ATP-binding protein n=1 Tax=Haloarchaeobius salinus TaxID=1198298 RepID=UPI00210CF204|nr:ABC transporter ATP-binding protein [Haloarchaeobius salinus]